MGWAGDEEVGEDGPSVPGVAAPARAGPGGARCSPVDWLASVRPAVSTAACPAKAEPTRADREIARRHGLPAPMAA